MGADEAAHDLSTNTDDAAGKEDLTDSLNLVMASLDDEDSDDDAAVQASVRSSVRAIHSTSTAPPHTAPAPMPTGAPVLQPLPAPAAPVLPIVTSQPTVAPLPIAAVPITHAVTPVTIADSQPMPTMVQNQSRGHPRLSTTPTPVSIVAGVTCTEGEGGGLVETGMQKRGKKKSRVASLNVDGAPVRRSSRNA
jgi:hypothetical protein